MHISSVIFKIVWFCRFVMAQFTYNLLSAFHVNSVLFHVLQESIPFGKSLDAFCTVESCSNAVDNGHVCL